MSILHAFTTSYYGEKDNTLKAEKRGLVPTNLDNLFTKNIGNFFVEASSYTRQKGEYLDSERKFKTMAKIIYP